VLSFLDKAQLYFHTLRYLKPAQILGRIVFGLQKPKPDLRPAPAVRCPSSGWKMPAARRVSMLSPTRFHFLNEAHDIPASPCWGSSTLSKLWLYNLHYFDDLNAEDLVDRAGWHGGLIARWIVANPPGEGTGWEPYPLSLRITNWIKWALAGNPLDDAARYSLGVQVRFLKRRLECHLLGNHLFANAKALVFAGCYFDGQEATGWLRLGMKILEHEVTEQILADGGHFERSTMYHALAYEDMLDLVNLITTYPERMGPWKSSVSSWPVIIGKMGGWLHTMLHPDGELAFFNDAAIGIAPSPSELFAYAERLGLLPAIAADDEVMRLDPSGYIRVEVGAAVLLVDVAPVGPDYLPGHAHADTLSFELSLFGQRVVVNSGTSRYGLGKEREWERSTAAHSTLEIDGKNSSEVWAGFRVARRAYPFDVSVKRQGDAIIVEAAHDGYKRLPGHPVHRRRWILRAGHIEVSDFVEGRFSSAMARVYFHPDIKLKADGGAGGTAQWRDHVIDWQTDAESVAIKPSSWAPEFGLQVENVCLEVTAAKGRAIFSLSW
jgi:uncharacterized heparinase superfamily protein